MIKPWVRFLWRTFSTGSLIVRHKALVCLRLLLQQTLGQYRLIDASAIQATQVYAMADHYALLSIAALLFGILLEISQVASRRDDHVSMVIASHRNSSCAVNVKVTKGCDTDHTIPNYSLKSHSMHPCITDQIWD
jgi:hypothetical protein